MDKNKDIIMGIVVLQIAASRMELQANTLGLKERVG